MPVGANKDKGYPGYRGFFARFFFYFPVIFFDVLKKSLNGKSFKLINDPLIIKTLTSIKGGDKFPYDDSRRRLLCESFSFSMKMVDELIRLSINHPHLLEFLLLKNFLCFCYVKTFEELDELIFLEITHSSNNNDLGSKNAGIMLVISCIRGVNKLIFNQFLVFIRCLKGERYAEIVVLLDI